MTRLRFHRTRLGLIMGIVAVLFPPVLGAAHGQETVGSRVDFQRDVEPILRDKCLSCHGAELAHGGLRLDDPGHAGKGGHSRRTILGGSLDSNELHRRLVTDDPALRMPKNAPALSREEIGTISQWIREGSPWVDPKEDSSDRSDRSRPPPGFWDVLEKRLDAYSKIVQPVIIPLVLALLLIAGVERYQDRVRKAAAASTENMPAPTVRWPALLRVTRSHYLNMTLIVLVYGMGHWIWNNGRRDALASARAAAEPAAPPDVLSGGSETKAIRTLADFGMPPRPLRPRHPKWLKGTYYRGNCERNAELYNGGSYQTARFSIQLCDADGNAVVAGDRLPESGLFLQFDMERPAGTHDSFYSSEVIDSIALSRQVFSGVEEIPTEPLARLEATKPGWVWTARYPLEKPRDALLERWDTTIYVYRGPKPAETGHEEKFSGEFHYAICCELRVKEGRLAEGSEIWMGSLFMAGALEMPTPGKVPLSEWFDFRPLPEIVGGNTTSDPKLLGIPTEDKK